MSSSANNAPVISKTYDLLKFLIVSVIKKIPKDQRFLIGAKLQKYTNKTMELLIIAYYSPTIDKKPILAKVNIKLEILRHYVRLCYELGFYDSTIYKKIALQIDEIGRMTGAWIKSLK